MSSVQTSAAWPRLVFFIRPALDSDWRMSDNPFPSPPITRQLSQSRWPVKETLYRGCRPPGPASPRVGPHSLTASGAHQPLFFRATSMGKGIGHFVWLYQLSSASNLELYFLAARKNLEVQMSVCLFVCLWEMSNQASYVSPDRKKGYCKVP